MPTLVKPDVSIDMIISSILLKEVVLKFLCFFAQPACIPNLKQVSDASVNNIG